VRFQTSYQMEGEIPQHYFGDHLAVARKFNSVKASASMPGPLWYSRIIELYQSQRNLLAFPFVQGNLFTLLFERFDESCIFP
jgi:hypothetical protein